MTFSPEFTMTPRMVRQMVAVERTNGFIVPPGSHP